MEEKTETETPPPSDAPPSGVASAVLGALSGLSEMVPRYLQQHQEWDRERRAADFAKELIRALAPTSRMPIGELCQEIATGAVLMSQLITTGQEYVVEAVEESAEEAAASEAETVADQAIPAV